MSVIIFALVIFGFSFVAERRLIHPDFPRPPVVFFHGVTAMAWVILFGVQSWFIASGNRVLHRRLGLASIALGAVIPVFAAITGVVIRRYRVEHFGELPQFVFISIYDAGVFGMLFWLGIYFRKKPEFHRRLMLLATISLTIAAIGRIPPWITPPRPHWILYTSWYVMLDILFAAGAVRDMIIWRKVHPIYRVVLPPLFVTQIIMIVLYDRGSHFWKVWSLTVMGLPH